MDDKPKFSIRFVSTMWQLEANKALSYRVKRQIAIHPIISSIFDNPHTGKFFANFYADSLQEAQLKLDILLEDILFDNEYIRYDWSKELEVALIASDARHAQIESFTEWFLDQSNKDDLINWDDIEGGID